MTDSTRSWKKKKKKHKTRKNHVIIFFFSFHKSTWFDINLFYIRFLPLPLFHIQFFRCSRSLCWLDDYTWANGRAVLLFRRTKFLSRIFHLSNSRRNAILFFRSWLFFRSILFLHRYNCFAPCTRYIFINARSTFTVLRKTSLSA